MIRLVRDFTHVLISLNEICVLPWLTFCFNHKPALTIFFSVHFFGGRFLSLITDHIIDRNKGERSWFSSSNLSTEEHSNEFPNPLQRPVNRMCECLTSKAHEVEMVQQLPCTRHCHWREQATSCRVSILTTVSFHLESTTFLRSVSVCGNREERKIWYVCVWFQCLTSGPCEYVSI